MTARNATETAASSFAPHQNFIHTMLHTHTHTHTERVMEHLIRTANSTALSFHPHSTATISLAPKGGNARLLSSGSTAAICHYSNCFVPITYGSDCCSRTAKTAHDRDLRILRMLRQEGRKMQNGSKQSLQRPPGFGTIKYNIL